MKRAHWTISGSVSPSSARSRSRSAMVASWLAIWFTGSPTKRKMVKATSATTIRTSAVSSRRRIR